jgi:hypothetical protein
MAGLGSVLPIVGRLDVCHLYVLQPCASRLCQPLVAEEQVSNHIPSQSQGHHSIHLVERERERERDCNLIVVVEAEFGNLIIITGGV